MLLSDVTLAVSFVKVPSPGDASNLSEPRSAQRTETLRRPSGIAEVLAFCASDEPGHLTGTDIIRDGGVRAVMTPIHALKQSTECSEGSLTEPGVRPY